MATPDQIRRRGRWSLVFGTVVAALLFAAVAYADNVVNTLDTTVDPTKETMNLTVGSGTGSTRLWVQNVNAGGGDTNNACNLAGAASLTVMVQSADTSIATVSPSTVTLDDCSDGDTTSAAEVAKMRLITVTPVSAGSTDIAFSQNAFNGSGTFNYSTATFTVNVAAAPSDSTPPVITPTVSGTLGDNGWYVSDVNISWTIADNESSISSSSGCGPTSINLDTSGTTLTCSATSPGGTASQSVTIKRDATDPTITGSAAPEPNSDGWNNSDVVVSFTCDDNLSGVAGCGPDQTLASEGRDQSVTGTATDGAGNDATATVGEIDIDKTGPNVTASTSVASVDVAGTEWYKDSVAFTWAAVDPNLGDSSSGSGVKTGPTPATSTFSTTGTGYSESTSATDYAGNLGTGTVAGINVDATAPTAQFTDCPTSPLVLGSPAPTVHWSASDLGSGLATASSGSVELDTSSVGSKAASSPAPQDNVGHAGTAASCTYSVIFDWNGFFSPVENPSAWNSAKAGQSIPVKFSLGGDQGLSIFASGFPRITQIACPTGGSPDPIEEYETTTANSKLIYDASEDQYNYVWKTDKLWAGKCFRLEVKLIDGTSHYASFKFTK